MAPKILDASLIPLEKALLARAEVLEKTSNQVPEGHPDEFDAHVYACVASEFRALAEELRKQ